MLLIRYSFIWKSGVSAMVIRKTLNIFNCIVKFILENTFSTFNHNNARVNKTPIKELQDLSQSNKGVDGLSGVSLTSSRKNL